MEASGARRLYLPRKNPGAHWTDGWVGSRAGLDVPEKLKIAFPCRDSNHAFIQSRLNLLSEIGGRTGRQYCEGKIGKQEYRVLHFTQLTGRSFLTSERTRWRHQSVPKRLRSPLFHIPEDYNLQQQGCENHRSSSVAGFEFRRSPSQTITCNSGPYKNRTEWYTDSSSFRARWTKALKQARCAPHSMLGQRRPVTLPKRQMTPTTSFLISSGSKKKEPR